MPLYNAAAYLRGALEALLAQDYPDFEIFISDNASKDETQGICLEYAAKEPRIHYHREEKNKGATWNFTHTYQLARGEYFMWAAHDDLRKPDYLSRCVAALNNHPRALFCRTGVEFIDGEGRDITDSFGAIVLPPVGRTAGERLRAIARSTYWVDFYSLFRTRAMAGILPVRNVWGGDVLFVAAMTLRGEVAAIPERLFQYRLFMEKSAEQVAGSLKISVSWLRLTVEMLKEIRRAPLGLWEKVRLGRMFVSEFCLCNATVHGYIAEERFRSVREALARRQFGRAFTMGVLGAILFSPAYFQNAWKSIRGRLTQQAA
jgi:glycosyltransferase involved in cell wall biosynthesis